MFITSLIHQCYYYGYESACHPKLFLGGDAFDRCSLPNF